jgi:hypothetical protein
VRFDLQTPLEMAERAKKNWHQELGASPRKARALRA